MAMPGLGRVWRGDAPKAWPDPPVEMTFSTLTEIEKCPRCWALGAASYPELWNGRGYPPQVNDAALLGTVVHLVLEVIANELARAQCRSMQDAEVSQVMRNIGGYTKIVNSCIESVLQRLVSNPRAASRLQPTRQKLFAEASNVRARVQTIMAGIRTPIRQSATANKNDGPKGRFPLGNGMYPEVELRVPRIGWKGKVDLLCLSGDICEITDYKTGAQSESHIFQLHVYALLWSRDLELNPNRRLADKLVLRYGAETIEVDAPNADQLDVLERQLVDRRDFANREVCERPPSANPTEENCRYCGVRQLCDQYWSPSVHARVCADRERHTFADAELTIVGRHGPSSWDAVINAAAGMTAGSRALMRASSDHQFRHGDRLRVLDAVVTQDPEQDVSSVVVTLSRLSQLFVTN